MKRLIAGLPFIAAVIFGGFFLWGLNPDRDPNEIPSVLISQPAPAFDLDPVPGLETPGLARSDLVGNERPVVVNVFASWCVPCREEHPLFMQIAREGKVPLHGLNYKDQPRDVENWLNTLGDPYTRTGADLDGRVAIDWGVYGVPETYLIDAEGRIRFKNVGPLFPETLKEIQELIGQL